MGVIIKKAVLAGFTDVFADAFRDKIPGNDLAVKDATFVVTQDCTLRCSYCYETHKNPDHDMTFETGKKIVDFLFAEDAKNSKLINKENAYAVVLDFIGGEPLMKIDLIDQIMDYFIDKAVELDHRWKYNYMIQFSTNGTEYFNENVQKFLKKWAGKVSLGITIDGNKKLHDSCRRFVDGSPSFDIVQKAYKDALAKGYSNNTKITISQFNLPYIEDAIKEIITVYPQIDSIFANCVFEAKWTIDNAKMFYQELKNIADYFISNKLYEQKAVSLFDESIGKYQDPKNNDQNWCGGGGGKMLAFDSNGDIYPCLRFLPMSMSMRDPSETKFGTLKDGFGNTEEAKKAIEEFTTLTRSKQSSEKCMNCKIGSGCAWCSGWNYDVYGTICKRFTGICVMHQARVLANAYYWNTLYRSLDMPDRFELSIEKDWALEIISEDEYEMLMRLQSKD